MWALMIQAQHWVDPTTWDDPPTGMYGFVELWPYGAFMALWAQVKPGSIPTGPIGIVKGAIGADTGPYGPMRTWTGPYGPVRRYGPVRT